MNIIQLRGLICVVLLAAVQAVEEVSLPSSVKICNHELPNYSACLKSSLQEAWPTIVKGIPGLGVPVLDPLKIDLVKEQYQLGAMQSRMVARDLKINGFANTIFQAVRPTRSANHMSIEVDIIIPHVFMEGKYNVHGGVGSLKVNGKGYFNMSSDGNTATWRLEGRIENDRWVLEHVRSLPEAMNIDKLKVYFDDLFNGNQELNKAAMTFINEFWPVLYKTLHPLVEEQWDARLTDLLNDLVFSKLSFAKTFP